MEQEEEQCVGSETPNGANSQFIMTIIRQKMMSYPLGMMIMCGRDMKMTNGDLISRSAAIEAVERREKLMIGEKRVGVEHIKTFLQNRPAADVELVRDGTWIGLEYDGYADGYPVYDLWECSECGYEHKGEDVPNYCPNCGARMCKVVIP